MKRFWQFGIAAVVLIVLAAGLASCKDDKKKDSTTTEPTASSTETGSSETPAEGDSGEANDKDLDALAAEYGVRESKVAYTLESSADGTTSSGTMTVYWKPEVGWRVDFDMDGSAGSMITKDGATYFCTSEGGSGNCFQSPVSTAAPIPFFNYLTDPDAFRSFVDTAGTGYEHSNETIAGKEADCFTATVGDEVSGKYCFADGILLLVTSSVPGSGDFSFTATSVDESVADGDLDPPYPIVQIPTG